MNFIVNADDFGKDRKTSDAILACFRNGMITHATVMVNMADCERAMRQALVEHGMIDYIGLHLNLTEGRPLTDLICSCPLFCDADGFFNRGAYRRNLQKRLRLSREERVAVEYEVLAQARRFFDLGGRLPHADSHHHVHFDWSIACVILPILKRLGFCSVRIGYNIGVGRSMLVRIYRGVLNRFIIGNNMARSQYFGSHASFLHEARRLERENACVEIMVHPVLVDGVIRDGMDGEAMSTICNCWS